MAVSYMEGEAENSLSRGYTYSLVSGTTNKDSFRENGTPWDDALDIQNNGQQKYEYKLSLYNSFEKGDTRCDATFMPSYPVSYTHLRAHETGRNLVCRLLLEKKKEKKDCDNIANNMQKIM